MEYIVDFCCSVMGTLKKGDRGFQMVPTAVRSQPLPEIPVHEGSLAPELRGKGKVEAIVGHQFSDYVARNPGELLLEIRRSPSNRTHYDPQVLRRLAQALRDTPVKVMTFDASRNDIPDTLLEKPEWAEFKRRWWPSNKSDAMTSAEEIQSQLIFLPPRGYETAGYPKYVPTAYEAENKNPRAIFQWLFDLFAAGPHGDSPFMSELEDLRDDLIDEEEKAKEEL